MDEPISAERWRQISALLDAALTLPPERRAQFLAEQTVGDPSLLLSVQSLLDKAPTRDDVLDRPVADGIGRRAASPGLPKGSRLGAYRVLETIGRGGMGEVYRAERADGVFQKQVAAKVLRPEAAEHLVRFEAERQVVARLDHSGIARLLDGGITDDGRPYMVMEYVSGRMLTEHVQSTSPTLDGLLELFLQICAAVSFAHDHGVIHRDLKPANVLVTADGRSKLLDFGVAKLIEPAAVAQATSTVAPLTVAYAAPEQLQGKSPTAATDVHALGVILYELLTGRLPWREDAGTPLSIMMQRILNEEAPPARISALPSISSGLLPGLNAILARCLRKKPAERYASVADLAQDLSRFRRGEAITARSTASVRASQAEQAERRQLTVLFCDLVDSTTLSDQMDPELFRELVLAYQNAVADVVVRYTGHVAQYLGDGMLVYFGYPQAQEDDAERAVRCSYDILEALTRLNHQPPLQARIGIHTGPVVIGQMGGAGRSETLAMGATTNVAARLQSLAQPHTVILSQSTLKLVPGMFITRSLGPQTLKGLDRLLNVFQLIQASGIRSRLEAAEHLTPFVGRSQEVALLNDRWEQAREGQGQVVLLTAEPGLGKSRLLLTLREQVAESAHTWLEGRCSPMARNSAFTPVVELLNRGLQLKEGDNGDTRLQRLEQALDDICSDRQEAVPLLAPLINLTLTKAYPPSPYGPELKRRKLLALLYGWILALARQQPLLLAIEDLHWADPSSLELIHLLIEQIPSHCVLLVLTARPEFQAAWPSRSHTAHLTLQALRTKEAGQMLGALTADKAMPKAVEEKIFQRAGGVPLFLEEITKALLESGQLVEREGKLELTTALDHLSIPETLQDSLTARIDRLGDAKSLIQLCSVVGRGIPYKLLPLIAGTDETGLQANLKTITEAQLLYQQGSPPDATYLFKHALIQDTAYNALLKTTKQKLHGQIATALEQHFKERVKAEPAVLAEHFEKADQIEKAAKYYQAAGNIASSRTAAGEAIAFFEKALGLLPSLAEGAHRDKQEFTLLADLVSALGFARGFAHPSTRATLERARKLLTSVDDPMAQGKILAWLGPSHNMAGEYEIAAKYGAELAASSKGFGIAVGESFGHMQVSFPYCCLGRFADALVHSEEALRYMDVDLDTARQFADASSGADPAVLALAIHAKARWPAGYPDDALTLAWQAIARANAIGAPQAACMAVTWGPPHILRLRRDWAALMQACVTARAHCDRYGFEDGRWEISANTGIALCMLDRLDEGLAMLRQAITIRESMGTMQGLAWDWGDMAAICLGAGRLEEARAALDEALAVMERHDERFWEAELHRVDGKLRLAESNDEAGAEACFHEALEVSRRQEARSLELRAATSLAGLWQRQGRVMDARDLLATIHDWFTEGFDTQDLKDARALLDRIEGAAGA